MVSPTVATAGLLLVYVTAPLLSLLATTVNVSSITFFVVGGLTNANVVVPLETVSVLLDLVALKYWAVCDWAALNDTSPAATIVIVVPEASTVATFVLLLL